MPLSQLIQMLIHNKLEVGAGSRATCRIVALVLGVVALAFLYDIRAYRNLATPEAMDAAQLARNISKGKGYTTQFIRPVQPLSGAKPQHSANIRLVDKFAPRLRAHQDGAPRLGEPAVKCIRLMLAGLMKVLPFQYAVVNLKKPFWTNNGAFWRYQPDFFIAIFNEVFLIMIVVLTFFFSPKNFSIPMSPWLSTILVLGYRELLWRSLAMSGLPTMLLLVIFLGLTLLLLEIERSARETQPRRNPTDRTRGGRWNSDWHRRADAVCLRLDDHSGRVVCNSF